MDLSLSGIVDEIGRSLFRPRDGLRRILALQFPVQVAWLGLCLMAIASAVLMHVSFAMIPAEDQDMVLDAVAWLAASPFRSAMLQGTVMVLQVGLIFWLGRKFGGKGNLVDTLFTVAWFQFVMLVVQLVQLGVQVVLPPFAALVNLAGLGLFLWVLTNFVAELHGFRSLMLVFLGIIFGSVLLLFLLAIVLLMVVGMPIEAA